MWQVSTQLISAGLVIYALRNVSHASSTAMVLRPWFIALVAAGAIERLAGLALGVAMERDWVVLVGLLILVLLTVALLDQNNDCFEMKLINLQ